jgi:hypothetical protein
VLKSGFQLDSLVHTCTVKHMYTQIKTSVKFNLSLTFQNVTMAYIRPTAVGISINELY